MLIYSPRILSALTQLGSTTTPNSKGGKCDLRYSFPIRSGNRTLLREEEMQSWDVQVETETNVRRRCVDGDQRGNNKCEEWGKAYCEIWGPELIAEQGTEQIYGWLLWVNLNLCILRCSTYAYEFRCSRITEMEVLRDRSIVRGCKLQTLQMDDRNLKE